MANTVFLPYVRRGLATAIAGGASARAESTVHATIAGHDVSRTLPILGPADVIGFDARAVVRTWPRADVFDGEPNYFPLVEFSEADLPWRYTPLEPEDGQRLKPWLTLIVLTDDETESWQPPSQDRPLGAVTVRAGTPLPNLADAWAWTHAEVRGDNPPANVDDLARRVRETPSAVISRLLCPRFLQPRTSYTGYLVPTFERGRLAGLHESLGAAASDALSWSGTMSPGAGTGGTGGGGAALRLPVYFRFRFGTGSSGDFEELLRRLVARRLGANVGQRPLDLTAPGAGVPSAGPAPIPMYAALVPADTTVAPWSDADRRAFANRLREVLNAPSTLASRATDDPVVTPPIYGHWHAERKVLGGPDPRPFWMHDMNDDPRMRVAAGLGTSIVQRDQESLMASAWEQYDRVRRANEQRAIAQLGRVVSAVRYTQDIVPAGLDTALGTAFGVTPQVRTSPTTIAANLEASPVSEDVLDPAFRRLLRPRGAAGRRQQRGCSKKTAGDFIATMNEGLLEPPPPGVPSAAIPSPENLAACVRKERGLAPSKCAPAARATSSLAEGIALLVDASPRRPGAPSVATAKRAAVAATGTTPSSLAERVAEVPPRPRFRLVSPLNDGSAAASTIDGTSTGAEFDSFEASTFRSALIDVVVQFDAAPLLAPAGIPIDIERTRSALLESLDPGRSFSVAFASRLGLVSPDTWIGDDPLSPVMAYPEFEEPMYRPLRDLSQDWIMPGLDRVPRETIALAQTNWAFVEAYMVGLSYEMARELVWREFPTDQRGTYFRQFWDRSAYVAAARARGERVDARDIAPIDRWYTRRRLGQARFDRSAESAPTAPGEQAVLLIRGELLRRYPNTLIYLIAVDGGAVPNPDHAADRRTPILTGALPPDVTFIGFDISPDEMQRTRSPDGRTTRRWYFVFQEQGAESRFGFDESSERAVASITRRSDLAWPHIGTTRGSYVSAASAEPTLRRVFARDGRQWAIGQASAARYAHATWQEPVMLFVPASELLPSRIAELTGGAAPPTGALLPPPAV